MLCRNSATANRIISYYKTTFKGGISVWPPLRKVQLMLLLFLGFWFLGFTQVYGAPLDAEVSRIYGANRIETAIQISQEGWQEANTVLLARSDSFPDSLVSVPLSKRYDAPILLTPSNSLDEKVLEEIIRLQATHVILLGGEGVMGKPIVQELEKAGLTWERIGGFDRFETATLVAQHLGANGQVILASGENFPDALSVGPYAGITETPILLTKGKELPPATKHILDDWGAYLLNQEAEAVTKVYVIGGEKVISPEVVSGFTGMTRLAGADRYETAADVFLFTQKALGEQSENPPLEKKVYLVTGQNFPDALVTGALAVKENTYLFMAKENFLPAITYSVLGNAAQNLKVVLIGGEGVLTDQVAGVVAGTIQPPYLLAGMTIVVDPGHGGKDPGAGGPSGTKEKDNTLATGLKLADLLRQGGARVVMTRTGDAPPTGENYTQAKDLAKRVEIANQINADLYVSIHNDAFTNPEAGGTTTYYSLENPVSSQSSKLAHAVQRELVKQIGLQDRKVKTANFYVIKHTKMPSILVELGFISNPTEEKLLRDPEFQRKAALGIYRGILVYKGY